MYSNEYDDEQDQEQGSNGSFLINFYNNNKVLVWIFAGIVIFILLMSILTGGGKNNKAANVSYDVTIIPEGDIFVLLGKSTNLVASVKNDPKAEFTWTVEDETIAKVDNGNVTGLDYGKTKVMATYIDNKNEKHTEIRNVTVAKGDPSIPLTDVSFKDGDLFMPLNSTYQIALTLTPSTGYVESEKFTSSDTNVATVDNNGLVTSVGEGSAIITFDVNGQFRKELNVYVDREYDRTEIIVTPSGLMFDGELRKIKVGTVEKLSYTVEPDNADTEKLIWESSDENIVTVDNGKIRGISEGMAVITVTALNGTKDRIDVEVESDIVQVTDINLSASDLYLNVGQSQTIMPMISPANASNKALSYMSLDSSVAFVTPNETGTQATITGVNQGTTTIVIRSFNNIEKRLNVIVAGNNQNQNGNNNSNSGNNNGNSGSTTSNQGFKITSKDANWETTHEGFIVTTHERTAGNVATPPVVITVDKTSSSVSKLVVLVCEYPASNGCGSLGRYETTNSTTFTLYNGGDYVIRVEEYNSSNNRTRTTDKYILVGAGSGYNSSNGTAYYTVTPGLYSDRDTAANNPFAKGTSLKFSVTGGYIKVCWQVGTGLCNPGKDGHKITGVTTFENFVAGLYTIRINQYRSDNTQIGSTISRYMSISSSTTTNNTGNNNNNNNNNSNNNSNNNNSTGTKDENGCIKDKEIWDPLSFACIPKSGSNNNTGNNTGTQTSGICCCTANKSSCSWLTGCTSSMPSPQSGAKQDNCKSYATGSNNGGQNPGTGATSNASLKKEIGLKFPNGTTFTYNGSQYTEMQINTTYSSDIYFCTGKSSSRASTSLTGAVRYNPGGGAKWVQPASSCNRYSNSTYATVYVPSGQKICVSITRNNQKSDDLCATATRGTTISTAVAKSKLYTCSYNGTVSANNSTNCLNSYLASTVSELEEYMDDHCTSASCKGCVYDSPKPVQYICKKS